MRKGIISGARAGLLGLGVVAAAAGTAQAVPVVGLTNTNGLVTFDSETPQDVTGGSQVSGLVPGDDLIGIDFRPANGLLYAVGTGGGAAGSARVYTIDPNTGIATQGATLSAPLSGTRFGFDFNPIPDRLRVVSNADQNLRINVDTGAVTVDVPLQYQAGDLFAGQNPNVVGSAYTNSFSPSPRETPGTVLYGIDTVRNTLVQQVNPNGGTLATVGLIGTDVSQLVGFDIFFNQATQTNEGYAAMQNIAEGVSRFYRINLGTGLATPIGTEQGDLLDGIALIPEPTSLALFGLGGLAVLVRRRRA